MTRAFGGVLAIGSLALVGGCSSSDDAGQSQKSVDPWPDVALSPAEDLSADPTLVEIDLHAGVTQKQFPGASQPSDVWAYNGTVPGPLVVAKKGDRMLAHFRNDLPEATTIHWHGVRVPNEMDGSLAMQQPVEPGGSFDYSFELKDAGLFWFHPHMRSDVQVERGLYAPIVVHGENEPKADHEAVLVLDDVRVLPDGTFPDFLDDESKMMGRGGNVLLVNGVNQPILPVRSGSLERWRIVNAANGRFFNLTLPGQSIRVIGTDGGLLPHPYDTDHVLIAPGERYDLMFIAEGPSGSEIELVNDAYDRGHDSGSEPAMTVATLRFTDQAALDGRKLPEGFPEIERLPTRPVDQTIELDEGLVGADLVFTINGQTWPNVPPITIPNGELRTLQVKNLSEMDHPFHLHGFFFQLLATNGTATPADRIANKDTLVVPKSSSVDLIARFDAVGRWMYHCHILEHAENGMMGEVIVE